MVYLFKRDVRPLRVFSYINNISLEVLNTRHNSQDEVDNLLNSDHYEEYDNGFELESKIRLHLKEDPNDIFYYWCRNQWFKYTPQ